MKIQGIGATTEVDKHNCRITKEALEEAIKKINTGKYVPSMGLEHDSSLMPIGKTYKAELRPLKNGEYAAYIYQETFENFNVFKSKEFGTLYEASISSDSRPFADTEPENIEKFTVQFDPVNFGYESFELIKEQISKDIDVEIKTFMRKSVIPDPEVVFNFIKDSFILLAATQTLNKTVEKVSSDGSNLYDKIKQIVIKAVKYIKPSNRPITYVMKENRGYILELLIRTADPNVLFQALSSEKLSTFINDVDSVKDVIDEPTYKIQYIYNENNACWEFNYLSTSTGKVIGSEKCYKKTMKLSSEFLKKHKP